MQYENDPLILKVELAVVLARRGDYGPLKKNEAIFQVCRAVLAADKALSPSLTQAQREAHLMHAGQLALHEKMAGMSSKPGLMRGVGHLPRGQQLVLSLKYGEDGCSDMEAAAALGCTVEEVRTLLIVALQSLIPRP